MSIQRDLARVAMIVSSSWNDFQGTKLKAPNPLPAGAFPMMTREMVPANHINSLLDLIIMWGIGDFGTTYDRCSTYYDPTSPWYNVFYGVYAMSSYKPGAIAWGYDNDGKPDFDEFLQLAAIDYNFFTAAQFGCPPSKMCFSANIQKISSDSGWDVCDVTATIPSGLHDPTRNKANIGNYIAFGIPEPNFFQGRSDYEPVPMRGQFYMRRLSGPTPITMVFGTACPDPAGNDLLQAIMGTLKQSYLSYSG